MSFIAVPNIAEGRDEAVIAQLTNAVSRARLLDIHRDFDHNRTVFTLAGDEVELTQAAVDLAIATRTIDMRAHVGAHPWLGALDVFPIVPIEPSAETLVRAERVATDIARAIGERARRPVYLYGRASTRSETSALPALRKGGLDRLTQRAKQGLIPDFGPNTIDARSGVVCVGARGPLIAFNVMVDGTLDEVRAIAARVRATNGGPLGIRALGLWLASKNQGQVSMNLTAPERTSIESAFDVVAGQSRAIGVEPIATEIVGLPLARYLPDEKSEAARLLIEPGRSLEEAISA